MSDDDRVDEHAGGERGGTDPVVGDDGDDLTSDERALLASVDALLADPATWSEPSAEVERRVVSAIAAERAATLQPNVTRIGEAPRRWRGTALAALCGAAAAAFATVLILDRDDEQVEAADAVVELVGSDLAPGVSGSAELRSVPSGVEIRITAPGLPRRDGGDFYQMWVKNCAETELVPAGTFHDVAEAIGWVGVPSEEYPVITVTRERIAGPNDPLQGSSGEVVLAGALTACT